MPDASGSAPEILTAAAIEVKEKKGCPGASPEHPAQAERRADVVGPADLVDPAGGRVGCARIVGGECAVGQTGGTRA